MFHNHEQIKVIGSARPAIGAFPAAAVVEAFLDLGVESASLAGKLLENTQKLCLDAATHKDAKDASRTMAAFVNASYRDITQNAEAVRGIWGRFIRAFSHPGS